MAASRVATVVVPWRYQPERAAAHGYCTRRWQACGYDVHVGVGVGRHEPWCKARALAPALDYIATPVVIVSDADVFVDCGAVGECVDACASGRLWAIPHREVRRLSAQASAQLIDGGELVYEYDEPPYIGVSGGGVVVLRTDVARAVPMDGRYIGWGREDMSWAYALDTLAGEPFRPTVEYPLYHLYHPHPERVDRYRGTFDTEPLYRAYFEAWATRDLDRMRTIVEEGRVWRSGTGSS